MSSPPTRRSGRKTQSTTRYTADDLTNHSDAADSVRDDYVHGVDDEPSSNASASDQDSASSDDQGNAESDDANKKPTRKPRSDKHIWHPPKRQRGLHHVAVRGSKAATWILFFGPADRDQQPAIQALYRWKNEPHLPTRVADKAGFGGFTHGFYRPDALRQYEMQHDWAWYSKELFDIRQCFYQLDPQAAKKYRGTWELDVLSGPYNEQSLHKFAVEQPISLDRPFKTEHDAPQRTGWHINIGHKIGCLDWAPNQNGPGQYLALGVAGNPNPRWPGTAYTPETDPSSIQIWHLCAESGHRISAPRLCMRICTDWGRVRSLRWCPVPRTDADKDRRHLGLLASVWGDGHIRVLDLRTDVNDPLSSVYCTQAALTAKPPDAIFTCVAWLSSTGLVAGTSNGVLAVFNVPEGLTKTHAQPILTINVQATYILSVVSCYPSRPQIVLSSSMSGQLTMTDLTDVSSALSATHTIPSSRSRIGKHALAWHDWSQSAITTDDSGTVYAIQLRRFFSVTGMTKIKSTCGLTATSPVHPFLMLAGYGGDVSCTNPLSRILLTKTPIWNQVWFSHTWRPRLIPAAEVLLANGDNPANEDTEMSDAGPPQRAVKRDGVIRILEGFKPERIRLERTKNPRPAGYLPSAVTLHEPESAVTAVGWNPNLHVGGWCAAGMASGLLRIEDVARDRT